MAADLQSREREVFLGALEQPDGDRRLEWLRAACGADQELLRQVIRLLKAHASPGGLLRLNAPDLTFETSPGAGIDTSRASSRPADPLGGRDPRDGPRDFLDPCPVPGRIGRMAGYEVLEVLGRGGMGVVLKAVDTKLNREVAIKVIAPELAASQTAVDRFQHEARLAAAVRHDNIVTIYSVDEWRGRPYLVMEYVAGETLRDRLLDSGRLDSTGVLRIGRQLASGLAAAHRRGLIHRDIKPANILLDEQTGRVRITDFGLARAVGEAGFSQAGEVSGTPQYMAPEQASGKPVDHRADLFSLGTVLYEMCTGHSPFQADSLIATLRRVCDDAPPRLADVVPDIPVRLDRLVYRLLSKTPDARPGSADEVEVCLAECEAHPAGGSPSDAEISTVTVPVTGPRSVARRLARTLAAIAGLLLAGLGLTELTGVTHLAGLVMQVVRGDGTIEVRVHDPSISVKVTGDEFQFTGAGVSTITVRPGRYVVAFSRDGKPLKQEIVSIERFGRKAVTMTFEPNVATARNERPEPEPRSVRTEPAADSLPGLSEHWSEPVPLELPGVAGAIAGRPALSADGLTLLLESDRQGGFGRTDLWMTTRSTRDEPFGPVASLGSGINSAAKESDPHLSVDGLTLIFSRLSHPDGHGRADLWIATRPSTLELFRNAANAGAVLNTASADGNAALSADGLTLIFSSDRDGGQGGEDLWMSTRSSPQSGFTPPVNLGAVVNSGARDNSPFLTVDGLQLWFVSERPGSIGHRDIWISTRPAINAPFGEPVNAGFGINSAYDEESPTLTADGRLLMFESMRPVRADEPSLETIWTAHRTDAAAAGQ